MQPPDAVGIPPATPRFSWMLQALHSGQHNLTASGYRVLVASSPQLIARDTQDQWDSGELDARQAPRIAYAGKALHSATTYYWKVAVRDQQHRWGPWSAIQRFTTGLSASDWKAHWIAAMPDGPSTAPAIEGRPPAAEPLRPLPLFRKALTIRASLASALIFVSGMGQYELRVNGRPVTGDVLTPGWTDYRRTVLYNSYNVTALLHGGANVLGILLGNGMYDVPATPGRFTKFSGSFGQPKLTLQMILRYSDGSADTIVSDATWTTHPGPILFSSIYGGEDTDARHEPPGWDRPGFLSKDWQSALEVDGPGGALQSQLSPPLIVARVYQPVRVLKPAPGVLVYDLGQNISGWPILKVKGESGRTVTLMPGELLDAHGFVTQRSGGGSATEQTLFRYTLRGGAVERWHPLFSYYGFRYVQVEGAALPTGSSRSAPTLLAISGAFVHAAVQQDGSFQSSSLLFDQIHALITKAILSNTVSVLTDCPTREKLGWLEQTHLNGGPLFLNYDMRTLYEKMAQDIRDAQLPDGLVPGIAPEYIHFMDKQGTNTPFRDSPEWGSAAILSPWTLYRYSGDRQALQLAYSSMQRYIAYLGARAKGHILDYGLGDWYDIGPKPPGESQLTSRMVTATATFYEDLEAMARIASILGHTDDAARYAQEATSVRDAFNQRLFHPETNQYDTGSQTANAMPLALGMVPAGHEPAVLNNLVADIAAHQDHVTAGDIGFHYLVRALTDMQRSDVLARILSRTDAPSYGYQLSRGATTLTEAWDANPNSSQNHFMLGHGDEWFYRGLAGIRFDLADKTSAIRFEPSFVPTIQSADAGYLSVLGEIHSQWRQTGNKVQWSISIPAGSTALVSFSQLQRDSIRAAPGMPALSQFAQCNTRSRYLACIIGSGSYTFTAVLDTDGKRK